MLNLDPHAYGPDVAALLENAPLCPLGPGRPDESKRARLSKLRPETLFAGARIANLDMARCCLSGLWLLYDFLGESHVISQEIDTPSGSYWHGIVHRREPDHGNAKYWFRRVGMHPVFEPLRVAAGEIAGELFAGTQPALVARWLSSSEWDAFGFVDLCESASQDKSFDMFCRHAAEAEWRLLFDFCYRRSIG